MPPKMGGRLICHLMNAGLQALPEACIPSMTDTNTGSKASFSRMQAWLDICTSSHPACNRGDTLPPPLPTRVIAVGSKRSRSCFLVSGADKRGNYATLSHCWGTPKNRPLTTTDKTLKLRQEGIKDEELPKTFRDAVQVCRELGIEYLWIDSLCIIQEQDSQEDWAQEAPNMGDVYGNSILTIAASVAADSAEGCFKERLGIILWPCPALLFGQRCHVSRYPTKEESRGDPGDRNPIPLHPLNGRTWVLQEQVLSRRSLIFTSNRLIWRCASMSTSEKYPLGMPHAPNISTDNHRLLHCIVNDVIPVDPGNSDIDIYTCWYRMVMAVTSRKLTYEDDKLPAIAGVAKKFAVTANDNYHAGLWRGNLLIGILWHSTTLTASERKRAARAPSWSWASVNSQVSYLSILSAGCDASHLPISPLLDILDVLDPPTGAEHPFGVTSKASLQLFGALLPVVRDEDEDSGLFLIEHGTRYAEDIENFLPDHWGLNPSAETPWYCLPVCVRHDPYHRGIRGDPEPYIASWKESLKTGIDEFCRFNRVFGLVLEAVKGRQDTYSRVGACAISRNKGTEISRISLRERRTLTII
ncbi:HET-domain-containing protein [Melanomma pulvis-pyrius CBS 109.77]|uniref:HET-domain-containing protein n=1 Tax=Melanomma pulvis-pyrius CBS 109.77 TaxID=1314802 RepID=A0A6A6XKJ8_9PLEO|nr:HET-domain-containing protein [Melanomma pulvis-pyrius CBS 109.77]